MSTAAIFEAIRAGDSASVRSLLNSDPSLVSAKNNSGVSAVLMSAYCGRQEIRDLLLARGATLEMHDAAAVGNLERVKELVEGNPVLAKAFSPDGFPVVALATVFGHLAVARYLAEQGADINAPANNDSGYNALTGAVAGGHTEIVRWLLESGANANYRYGAGYSPLLTAAANGHLEIVKLLVAHHADANAISSDGKSALALATERNHPAVADYLRSLGV
ncbi:MAG TPA: ankyrin repeat domain-containing protein [Verrucomicrobiae bacterium]|nr:ankyrin repeat domain-containing protein [Verrucomicrobiae bacterium]